MLNPTYSYLFLDFETTGLDLLRDDPIQIGLVACDHEGKETARYTSPIRPNKPITELKSIVTYLTETSLEALATAPSMEQILPQIMPFFKENTIVIGHNIQFDLSFLGRYVDREPVGSLDTFPLSKTCFHFLPSYALEVIAHTIDIDTSKSHDALADCITNKEVFLHCIRHLQTIRHTYMIFDYILQNSSTLLASIIQRTIKPYNFSQKELFLPPLVKSARSVKKIIRTTPPKRQKSNLLTGKTFVGKSSLETILTDIDREKHNWLLVFSHKSKAHLAEQLLQRTGISPASMYSTPVFLPEHINRLLQKGDFDEAEVSFFAKYLSHHLHGHTLIDINSSDDYKIFSALTTTKPARGGHVIVATHEQLYDAYMPLDPSTHVLFFDHDRRRQTRANRSRKPIDPHYLLQYLDQAAYSAQLMGNRTLHLHIERLTNQLHLFFGILCGEIDNLYTGFSGTSMEITDLLSHPRLPKSSAAFRALHDKETSFFDHETLDNRRTHTYRRLNDLFSQSFVTEKRMYQGDKWYYTFSEIAGFHTFDEMQEHLPEATYTFLSTLQDRFPSRGSIEHTKDPLVKVTFTQPAQIISRIRQQDRGNIFIFCGKKTSAKDLFSVMVAQELHKTHLIVGENITGGVGKIVYLANQSTQPVIMIGGFGAFLAAREKKFAISHIIPYYCEGKQQPLYFADIHFYTQHGNTFGSSSGEAKI